MSDIFPPQAVTVTRHTKMRTEQKVADHLPRQKASKEDRNRCRWVVALLFICADIIVIIIIIILLIGRSSGNK